MALDSHAWFGMLETKVKYKILLQNSK